MDDIWLRLVNDLAARVSGPMRFRLVLQPLMACIFAIISGLKDAKVGNPPYFLALFTNPAHRADLLKDGWKSIGMVFIFALALDAIYQIIVLRFVYPGEAIVVAFLLAIVPYVLVRGPVNLIARKKR